MVSCVISQQSYKSTKTEDVERVMRKKVFFLLCYFLYRNKALPNLMEGGVHVRHNMHELVIFVISELEHLLYSNIKKTINSLINVVVYQG